MGKQFIFPATEKTEAQRGEVVRLAIEEIKPLSLVPAEPIKKIRNLMRTVEKSGGLAPVCVFKAPDGKYELLAGRQRIAIAIRAGLKEIPALVCAPEDENEAVFSIIRDTEGIFNCFEEADYLKRMVDSGRYTQRSLAEKIGKSQAYVSNKLRLSRLSSNIRRKIVEGGLSERHARLLLMLNDERSQKIVADCAAKEKLSVEKTEEKVKEMLRKAGMQTSADYIRAANRYRRRLRNAMEEEKNNDVPKENTDRLKLLIKAVSDIVNISRQHGLVVLAGQRNTEKNVELVIIVPRAENNVSLRMSTNAVSEKPPEPGEDAA